MLRSLGNLIRPAYAPVTRNLAGGLASKLTAGLARSEDCQFRAFESTVVPGRLGTKKDNYNKDGSVKPEFRRAELRRNVDRRNAGSHQWQKYFDELKPGDSVTDFGSGTGTNANYARSRVGPSGKVTLIDSDPDTVKDLNESFGDKAEAVVGEDLSSLPPNSQKLITSDRTLVYLTDQKVQQVVDQAAMATTRNGRFCFTFYPPDQGNVEDKKLFLRSLSHMAGLTSGSGSQFKLGEVGFSAIPDDRNVDPVKYQWFDPQETTLDEMDAAIAEAAKKMPPNRFVEVYFVLVKR